MNATEELEELEDLYGWMMAQTYNCPVLIVWRAAKIDLEITKVETYRCHHHVLSSFGPTCVRPTRLGEFPSLRGQRGTQRHWLPHLGRFFEQNYPTIRVEPNRVFRVWIGFQLDILQTLRRPRCNP